VDELIIVPDGALTHLPFGALQAAADGPRLAERYAVSLAPSATLWLEWSASAVPAPASGGALVLADPEFIGSDAPATGTAGARSWSLIAGRPLGRLPHARLEGQALLRVVGGRSRLLAGAEASERFVKQAELAGFVIVHFAGHALVDAHWPERSGLLLAPGAPGEDGLLQPREIAQLPLDDRLVVLSGCETAGGLLLHGEGVLGLARAFLQAGAAAVVATLWRVRDEEMAPLMTAIYRGLARGATIAEAVAGATREAIRSGSDPAAWASLVVLGDGGRRPLAARPPGAGLDRFAPAAAAVIVLAVVAFLWRRRRQPPAA
jgi:CHAT domain-containing protein